MKQRAVCSVILVMTITGNMLLFGCKKQHPEIPSKQSNSGTAKTEQEITSVLMDGHKVIRTWAGYVDERTEARKVFDSADNHMIVDSRGIESVPTFRFDEKSQLDDFYSQFHDSFHLEERRFGLPSFYEIVSGYDDAFFKENSLVVIYIAIGNQDQHEYTVRGVPDKDIDPNYNYLNEWIVSFDKKPADYQVDMMGQGFLFIIEVNDEELASYNGVTTLIFDSEADLDITNLINMREVPAE